MFFYSDEKNIQILINVLKANGIRYIVASPGSTNKGLVASMQQDPFFSIISVVDERSAGYIACGMAAEKDGKEPIVLTCTGATASRNYMPALTEAYYRKLPIIAVTSSLRSYEIGHNVGQVTNRVILPLDIVRLSTQMPVVVDKETEWACNIAANKAILELFRNGGGPVHINLETINSLNYKVKQLPSTRVINRFFADDILPEIEASKIIVFVGAHLRWDKRLTESVELFCERYNAIVLCDHTSNYNGNYKILGGLPLLQKNYISEVMKADMIIHIGEISSLEPKITNCCVWRVSEDGEIKDTFKHLKNVFQMREEDFFSYYVKKKNNTNITDFYSKCKEEYEYLLENITEIPFSNAWMANITMNRLKNRTILHLAIRNSLRCWSFFGEYSVDGFSNVGGFGIDGCLSSAIGAALMNKEKNILLVIGDLAFFYDMNSIGIRQLPKNLIIILVNNSGGAEFWLSSCHAIDLFGMATDEFVSAAGHYGNGSDSLVKNYVEALGFEYYAVDNKKVYQELLSKIVDEKIRKKPLFIEAFTSEKNDADAVEQLSNILVNCGTYVKNTVKKQARTLIGEKNVNEVKKYLNIR